MDSCVGAAHVVFYPGCCAAASERTSERERGFKFKGVGGESLDGDDVGGGGGGGGKSGEL